MSRILIVTGAILICAGLLWPWLVRSGLGRLPGDIVIHRGNFSLTAPIVTCLIISVVLSLISWLFRR